MVVAIHEVCFLANIQFGEKHLILGLHRSAILFLDDVLNLTDLVLARCPYLNHALRVYLVPQHAQFAWDELHGANWDSVDSRYEFHRDVRVQVLR